MNKKILFLTVMTCFITTLYAQSNKSTKAYAITSVEKGQSSWKEIRLIDVKTGEAETVFSSGQETEILNARTGKPVQKKDANLKSTGNENSNVRVYTIQPDNRAQVVNDKADIEKLKAAGKRVIIIKNDRCSEKQYDKPFATNSAALAYDKKHDRLYYTPMGINQLRYIDLKSKNPKVYYFEDETFGNVQGTYDVPNQITRMVIGSDGNGYALANNADHLLRFTTGKKPVITDLGSITDDASNGDFSIHRGVGGDMIADKSGNLYLITAYKNVWKINIETMTAVYKGGIKGLPEEYQTNGAVVEKGSKIIVCSGTSTQGYYRFDLNNLQAEKISSAGEVFNASDMANGNLVSADKKEKDETIEEPSQVKEDALEAARAAIKQAETTEVGGDNGILVYPNPVTDGIVKLSFNNQPVGKYNVQLLDMAGKTISNQSIVINSKTQVQEIRLPSIMGKGNYLVKVTSEDNKTTVVTKLAVQ
ncbi:MAG: T9SS type A sorting domain-containing protein [Ferruginibacter sp.]